MTSTAYYPLPRSCSPMYKVSFFVTVAFWLVVRYFWLPEVVNPRFLFRYVLFEYAVRLFLVMMKSGAAICCCGSCVVGCSKYGYSQMF